MLKVLLADTDNENLRNFKLFISKGFSNMRIVSSLSSGANLLDEIKRLDGVNLIIADIRFFGANGIETVSKIFELYPGIRYLVYGFYNDTPYIEKIMPYGVIDYIYRPVKPTELQYALEKAGRVFEQLAEAESDKAKTLAELHRNKGYYKGIFLRGICDGSIEDEFEIKSNFSYFGIKLSPPFTAILLKIDHFKSVILTLDEEEKHYLVHKLNSIVQAKINELGCGITFASVLHMSTVIVGGINDLRELVKLADDIRAEVALRTKQSVTVGIGRSYEQYGRIAVSCREAEAALRYRYFMGYNIVIPIHYAEPENSITYKYPRDIEDRIVYAAVSGEYEHTMRLASELCVALRSESLPDGLLSKIMMDIIISISRFINERDLINLENFTDFFPTAEVFKIKSVDDAFDFMKRSFHMFCSRMNTLRLEKGRRTLEIAKLYVSGNFKRNISLSDIAERCKTVPEYFSRLFSELEKKSVYEYITELRVEKAKELLEDSKYEEDAIAQLVGFDDYLHFRLVFKQLTGQNPIDYRKRYAKG